MDMQLVEFMREGWLDGGQCDEGNSLYLAKRGSDDITSSTVAARTNLFPS